MNQTTKKYGCYPTILNEKTLMDLGGSFISKEFINKKCNCDESDVCKQIVDLLNNGKLELAKTLLDNKNKLGVR